ncbi:MAG: Crp/Fnr family transcriptional regulator [Bacteroidales bacterium]
MQYSNPFIELCLEGPSSVFKGLTPEEKETLDKHHTLVSFEKTSLIAGEGSRTRGLMCLASGKAKVFSTGVGNREQIIKMLRPQNFINYRALYSDTPHPFSVAAIEKSSVVIFEKHTLSGILRQNSDLVIRFLKIISEDLMFTDSRLMSLTQKHVRGRVAESVLLLRDTYGLETDEQTLRVLLTREDFAHLSNMTTSNAIRTLSNLVAEGILAIEGRKISILDTDKLLEISRSGQ